MYINKDMLKTAAENTKGMATKTIGYIEIIYNLENGGVWAIYHKNPYEWTYTNYQTEITFGTNMEYNADELALLIKHEIELIQTELKKPEAKEGLPKRWVELIEQLEID